MISIEPGRLCVFSAVRDKRPTNLRSAHLNLQPTIQEQPQNDKIDLVVENRPIYTPRRFLPEFPAAIVSVSSCRIDQNR